MPFGVICTGFAEILSVGLVVELGIQRDPQIVALSVLRVDPRLKVNQISQVVLVIVLNYELIIFGGTGSDNLCVLSAESTVGYNCQFFLILIICQMEYFALDRISGQQRFSGIAVFINVESEILHIDLVLGLYEIDIGIGNIGRHDKAGRRQIFFLENALIAAFSKRQYITVVVIGESNDTAEQHRQRTHLYDQQYCHDHSDGARAVVFLFQRSVVFHKMPPMLRLLFFLYYIGISALE